MSAMDTTQPTMAPTQPDTQPVAPMTVASDPNPFSPMKFVGGGPCIAHQQLRKNRRGQVHRKDVTFFVPCRHGNYQYKFLYPHTVTKGELNRDLATLTNMAAEQSDQQELHNPLYGQDIVAAGLTAYVSDSVVHIDGMGACRLLLRFAIRETGEWCKHQWEANTPSKLPSPDVVVAYIQAELIKLSTSI